MKKFFGVKFSRKSGMPLVIEPFESRVLRGNPLRDPHVRRIAIWLPPSYEQGTRRYPVFYVLTGYTGSSLSHLNWNAWSESLPERLERLVRERRMREAIVVLPDCFTRYGGSQYLNSSATGRYEDHLVRELVPWVDGRYATIARPGARAVVGKSSGGYGAMVQAMRHPDVFGLVACHSGDMHFTLCYLPAFPKCLNALQKHGGDVRRFLRAWERMPRRNDASVMPAVEMIAMASCYSPNPRSPARFDMPFDTRTGEVRPDVWRRWLALDPVEMARAHVHSLRRLRFIYLDCGTRDEFALHYGARILSGRLNAMGIRHVHEEFDDGHMNIQYRYDRSLALLSRAFERA
jgi:enterochelin esterase family protein